MIDPVERVPPAETGLEVTRLGLGTGSLGGLFEPVEEEAALFLASDESRFVTGHALLVDGGYTAI